LRKSSLDALDEGIDLRVERSYQFAGWHMNLYLEMQNASLTKEIVGYEAEPQTGAVIEHQVFLPLPVLGLEVML